MIYLDHNASALMRPSVVEGVVSAMGRQVGNPSSVHWAGRAARQQLDEARRSVAALVNVHESRILFTSGGTEANNLALFGVARTREGRGAIITSAVEHPSILHACDLLARRGLTVNRLPVDGSGRVDPEDVVPLIDQETILVSVMAANNETGVLQPIREIGVLCRSRGVPFHVDATQWAGRLPLDADGIPADLLTLSAHKMGGPKGVGALVSSSSLTLAPRMVGGGQERGRRAGTENLPGIVGFGLAARELLGGLSGEADRVGALRGYLETRVLEVVPDAVIFGNAVPRLPNTTAVGVRGVDGETLVMTLDLAGCAISSGSACSSGKTTPSHVLVAMGVDPALSQSAVRISLGWDSSKNSVDQFIIAFERSVCRLRQGSALS
ncbi:MAG: cysteine desulfurase [Magnetococcales bacterium]|nr:cysteine desulfurase [Magnetococcales bacterium]